MLQWDLVHCYIENPAGHEAFKPALRVYLTLAGVLAIAWLWLIGCICWPCLQRPQCVTLKTALRRVWFFCRRALIFEPMTKVEACACLLVSQRREARTRQVVRLGACVLPLIAVQGGYDLYFNRWDEVWSYSIWFQQQLWLEVLGAGCICMFLTAFTRFVGSRTPDYLYLFLLGLFTIRLFLFTTVPLFVQSWFYMALVRYFFALVFGNLGLTLVLNSVFLACEILVLRASGVPDEFRSVFVFVLVSASALVTDRVMFSEALAHIEASNMTQGKALVHSVLSSVCDAVVTLQENLSIAEACPTFDALLMRERSCQGRCFLDFVYEPDRDRCAGLFRRADMKVESRHIRLAWHGGLLPVRIWHNAVREIDGKRTSLIGIQEGPDDLRSAADIPAAVPHAHRKPGEAAARKAALPESEVGTRSEASIAGQGERGRGCGRFRPGELAVCVDATDQELKIRELTVGLGLLLGPSVAVGTCLTSCAYNSREFVKWVQHVFRMRMIGTTKKDLDELNRFDVQLQVPGASGAVPTRCKLVFPREPRESDESSESSSSASAEDLNVYVIFRRNGRERCNTGASSSTKAKNDRKLQGTSRKVDGAHSGFILGRPQVMVL
mmetsp:Transcript_87988/g.249271  ORF Transcript_87988/g.249271 Transcript_87988/m.249271 type:complete len:610 (+) Transcript_87988:55-1884(+)